MRVPQPGRPFAAVLAAVPFERHDGDGPDAAQLDAPCDRHAESLGDLGVGRVAAEGRGQGSAGVRDRTGGVTARSPHGVESPDRIEDGAPDAQDGIRLERGTAVRSVGVVRRQQADHPGLHRVVLIEDADDSGTEPADDVAHEVAISLGDERALLIRRVPRDRHRQATAGPADTPRSTRLRPAALAA